MMLIVTVTCSSACLSGFVHIRFLLSKIKCVLVCVLFSIIGFLLGNLPEEHFSHMNMGIVTKGN